MFQLFNTKIAKFTLTVTAIIAALFSLSGCLPLIFTGATTSALAFAKDRPAGDTLTDTKIATKIKGELIRSGFRNIYSRTKVEVLQGRVLFTGLVEKEEHMITAIQIAWNQAGVTEVINEMKVDEKSGHFDLVQYTRDTMITSQIKSKIFLDRSIKFVNITVITVSDIVYLFGIARSEEELEKVANIAANVHSAKRVISHIKVNAAANKRFESGFRENLIDNDLAEPGVNSQGGIQDTYSKKARKDGEFHFDDAELEDVDLASLEKTDW